MSLIPGIREPDRPQIIFTRAGLALCDACSHEGLRRFGGWWCPRCRAWIGWARKPI